MGLEVVGLPLGAVYGIRWVSTSGYHLLRANCSTYLREDVFHREGLGTTCRDEGILTGNDLITLSQTVLTSSPGSPDITVLLGHDEGSRSLLMGMLLSRPRCFPQGTRGAAAGAATPLSPSLPAQ